PGAGPILPGMRTRLPTFLALAAVLLLAPACPTLISGLKTVGIINPPKFVLPNAMPSDFVLDVDVRDGLEPATDYILHFYRTGRAEYDVTVRMPRRRRVAGSFEITENQVLSLWKAVVAAKFD